MADKYYDLRKNPTPSAKNVTKNKGRNRPNNVDLEEEVTESQEHVRVDEVREAENLLESEDSELGLDNLYGRGDFIGNPNITNTTKPTNTDDGQDLTIIEFLKNIQMEIKNVQTEVGQSREESKKNFQTLTNNMTEIREELNNTKTELRDEIKELMDKQKGEIDQEIKQLEQNFEQQITEAVKKVNENCQNEISKNNSEIEDKLIVKIKLNESEIESIHRNVTNYKNETVTCVNQLTEVVNSNQVSLKNITNDITKLQNRTIDLAERHSDLREQLETNNRTNQLPTIHVTCGNSTSENLPKFNGRGRNPIEFLQQLKSYLNRQQTRRQDNAPDYEEILENCLVESAARWWQLIKLDTKSFKEFEVSFLEKYWNAEIQRGIKRRMDIEKFREGGKQNRTEYFIERVMVLRNMSPTLEEEEIISILAEHFDNRIKDAIRVQNVITIRGCEKLLGREDVEERNSQLRRQNTSGYTQRNENQNSSLRNQNRPRPEPNHNYRPDYRRPIYENRRPQPYGNQQYRRDNNPKFSENRPPYNGQRRDQQNYNNRPNQYSDNRDNQNNTTYPTAEQRKMCQMITTTKGQTTQQSNITTNSQQGLDSSNMVN